MAVECLIRIGPVGAVGASVTASFTGLGGGGWMPEGPGSLDDIMVALTQAINRNKVGGGCGLDKEG